MTREEAVALLERYSNYDGMGIQNLAGCKEAMRVAVDALKDAYPELGESEDERIRKELIGMINECTNWVHKNEYVKYLEKQKEQKPTEWSKNDTVFLNEIIDFFENKTVKLQHDIDMYAHWLKSLPERFGIHSKAEWSEEDKGAITTAIRACKYITENFENSTKQYEDAIERLKSLRPQSHWRPGEEQMKALEDAFRKDGSDEYRRTINSLYQDLKKL